MDPGSEDRKQCPECGHVFKGQGWGGIDAHWRSRHRDVMSYRQAWPLLRDGRYCRDAARKAAFTGNGAVNLDAVRSLISRGWPGRN